MKARNSQKLRKPKLALKIKLKVKPPTKFFKSMTMK